MTERTPPRPSAPDPRAVVRTTLAAGAVVVLALVAWQLSNVLLVGFAAVLFAVLLRGLAIPVERHTPLAAPWSLLPGGLLVAALVAGFVVLLGAQIRSEVAQLVDQLPALLDTLGTRIGVEDLRERLVARAESASRDGGLVGRIAGYTSGVLAVLANVVLVAVAGIYLAARPATYRRGLLALVPPGARDRGAATFDTAGRALRLWLLGQLVSMTVVGALVTAGLYALGMPSALALGFLAGVSEFVPLVGPALSAVPAILLAVSEGGNMVFWVAGLYLVVQQIEGNVIMPLVQRRMVHLPPALTLLAILAFGVLFGPLGVLLATPLTVVLYVAVKQLYIRGALGEETTVPGEG